MEIAKSAVLLLIGLVAVIKGGDWFVMAATRIARASGIPTFIIGATIVSIATTLPEMIVSCMAAASGSTEMAIGNAVGSVTANTGLIMCLAFVFLPVAIVRRDYILSCLLLIGAAAVLPLGSLGGSLAVWADVVLLGIFAAFMVYNVLHSRRQAGMETAPDAEERERLDGKGWALNIGLFVLGTLVVVGGSNLLVSSGTSLATLLGVPQRVIAVTLVAVGTSLPELVTTLTAIRHKEANLSIGNIVGANIIDLTLILPLCSLISGRPLPITPESLALDLPVCLGVVLLALVPLLIRGKAGKLQGLIPLAVYAGYLIVTL